jgi:hypothetical protein
LNYNQVTQRNFGFAYEHSLIYGCVKLKAVGRAVDRENGDFSWFGTGKYCCDFAGD